MFSLLNFFKKHHIVLRNIISKRHLPLLMYTVAPPWETMHNHCYRVVSDERDIYVEECISSVEQISVQCRQKI